MAELRARHEAVRAAGLHERLRFRHAGRLEGLGFKHARWLDTVIMQRALNPGERQPPGA